MAKETVVLQPSQSTVISFEVTPTVAKTYQVSVDGLTGSFTVLVSAPATLSGTVHDKAGNPLTFATVELDGLKRGVGVDGVYTFAYLIPGTYIITVTCSGYSPRSGPITIAPGYNERSIMLEPGIPTSVEGCVYDLGVYYPALDVYGAVPGAIIKLNQRVFTSYMIDQWHAYYIFEDLNPGGYLLSAEKPGYRYWAASIILKPGRQTYHILLRKE